MKIHFTIWFILLLLACLNESSLAQTNVWISGKLLNDQQEGAVDIRTDMFQIFPLTKIATSVVSKSGNFQFKLKITKPQVIQLFNKSFFITPGDSIYMNVTGNRYVPEKIEFKGRNANNYIYAMKYDSLALSFRFKYYEFDLKRGLNKYHDMLNESKNILLNYLNVFSNIHPLTTDFKAYALSQIVYDYYDQLLVPFIYKKYPIDSIPSSYSSILDQIKLVDNIPANKREYANKSSILPLSFISKDLYDKREYAYTATHLLKYKMLKSKGNELQLINDNFTGRTKDLLLTNYASTLIFSYSSKDSLVTKELFKKIEAGITSPEFRNYFKPFKDQFNKSLAQFPKEVMLTVLIDSIGHKLTFKDLLEKSKNKIIVLDFWASWCGPCIYEMPNVNKLKKVFSNSDVEFVFISIDQTESDWRGGLKKTKIPGNHYWIADKSKSALIKYLKMESIPRYVIINKSGNIEKMKAFGPGLEEYGLLAQLNKLLNL